MSQGRGISADPNDRMGVFKRIEDVPDRYRFYQHSAAYDGQDTYNQFVDQKIMSDWPDASDKYYRSVDRAGERWKAFMDERGRHHALATPEDVETWCEQLLDNLTVGTIIHQYWRRIRDFYDWLQFRPDHPHTYHPVLMAVAAYPSSKEIWNHMISDANRKGDSEWWGSDDE